MELYDSITAQLGEVNTVQLIGTHGIKSWVRNTEHFRWERQNPPEAASRWLETYRLASYLAGIPHVSRRRGTILMVTGVDPCQKIE